MAFFSYAWAAEAEHLGQLLRTLKKAKKLRLSSVPQIQKDCEAVRKQLLDPVPAFYCGDVNIEFRTGMLMYESLRRLQQDPRLPSGLNTVGNIRVIAGSLISEQEPFFRLAIPYLSAIEEKRRSIFLQSTVIASFLSTFNATKMQRARDYYGYFMPLMQHTTQKSIGTKKPPTH